MATFERTPVTVRFAPSPTGHIHIGNARTALYNWLYAKQRDGEFILRFDDTDVARSRPEYAAAIEADLAWLGINPDRIEYQSKRIWSYDAATEALKAKGLLYPCYETAEELERKRKLRLARRQPPVYGREALKQTQHEREALEAQGRRAHWRFLLPNFGDDPFHTRRTEIHWNDIVRGEQTVDLASMSDPVLVREDGSYLYTLPSVVDDIEMGVSHVIRGDDHVTNTGAQIALFHALGEEAPGFGHHNLLTTVSGEGLSKRSGALSLSSLRKDGYEAMAICSLAVLIGSADNVTAVTSMAELQERFHPARASRSAAKFDPQELTALNATLVHASEYGQVRERLAQLGIEGDIAESFWNAVRDNCTFVNDARAWWSIVIAGPEEADGRSLDAEDKAFVREAFDALPDGPVTADTWKIWTDAVKQKTGRKGRSLFMPLRVALTGRTSGPEIANLLPLMGRERILARRP